MKKEKMLACICICIVSLLAGCGKNTNTDISKLPNENITGESKVEEESNETVIPVTDNHSIKLFNIGLKEYSKSYYGEVNVYASCQIPLLYNDNADQYRTLQQTFEKYGNDMKSLADESLKNNMSYVSEYISSMDLDYYEPLSDENESTILRADTNAVSIYVLSSGYSGGAHGYALHSGHTYDTKSGKELSLSDVVTDTDQFYDIVLEKLKTKYADIYNEMWDPEDVIDSYKADPATANWTMTSEGVTVYFNEYELAAYAFGSQSITVYFDENPDLFVSKYMEVSDEYVIPLNRAEEYSLNVNGTRQDLIIDVIPQTEEDGELGCNNFQISLSGNDKSIYLNDYAFNHQGAVLFSNGKYYLYFQEQSEGDLYQNIYIDLQSMTYEKDQFDCGNFEKSMMTYVSNGDIVTYDEIKYPMINPSSFYISNRIEMLGSYFGTKLYHIGENGIPETNDSRYECNGYYIIKTNDTPLSVDVVDKDGNVTRTDTIPANTYLKLAYTDNKTCIDVQIYDGNDFIENKDEYYTNYTVTKPIAIDFDKPFYRIQYDNTNWPKTINGVDEETLFTGVLYVG